MTRALIVVDVQNDFCEGGSLAVAGGADVAFRINGLVHAWHEEGPEVKLPVTVRASGDAPLTIPIDVTGFKPEPHKNKYGKDYKPPSSDAEDERY